MNKHCIYYDPDCMMCSWYTKAMLNHQLLAPDGRREFQELSDKDDLWIDRNRARNEIALLDVQTGEVRYGIDSFLTLFAERWPSLRTVFHSNGLRRLMARVYKFISYNRKVISPPPAFEAEGSCTPDFKLTYRWAYIGFAWLITALILTVFAPLVSSVVPAGSFGREMWIYGGQILFQAAFLKWIKSDRIVEYLGNMMTISMVGALGLLPIIALHTLVGLPLGLTALLFIGVVFIMFCEHLRRVKYLELPWWLSASWVLYRVLILSIILI